jgi:hypothetical protein
MGYEIHITGREDWADTDTPGISINEWLSYVDSDKELELVNGYDTKIGSEMQCQHSPGFCEWHGHPLEKEPNSRPWFDYWKGSISTKNPDASTVGKMLQIASPLNAKVQGDDGEIYSEEYLAELENAEKQKSSPKPQVNKPWWKFWR